MLTVCVCVCVCVCVRVCTGGGVDHRSKPGGGRFAFAAPPCLSVTSKWHAYRLVHALSHTLTHELEHALRVRTCAYTQPSLRMPAHTNGPVR